jgi:hypothetical protein
MRPGRIIPGYSLSPGCASLTKGVEAPVMSRDILDLPPPDADARLAYGSDRFQFGELRLPTGSGRMRCW